MPNGRRLRLIGLVTMRQRPGTAKGTVFVTLEDSLLSVNVIVWPHIVERDRTALLGAHLMGYMAACSGRDPSPILLLMLYIIAILIWAFCRPRTGTTAPEKP